MPGELGKPLTLEGAETRARRVLERLVGGPEQARRFELRESGEAQHDWDGFRFVEFAQSSGNPALAGVYFHVRRSNGFVERCELNEVRLRPKVPYEKVAELAKAAGRTGRRTVRTDDIVLKMHYRGGLGTLTWDYRTPPPPGGGMPLDETWWDAMTGKLVYSKVLHGGTPEKPYQNPKYFPELNDETIKRNLEKLIKDRVAELEQKKSDAQGADKTPGGK